MSRSGRPRGRGLLALPGRRRRPADLLEVRLVGAPALVDRAAEVLGEALAAASGAARLERVFGPYPVRGEGALVRLYLRARLGRAAPASPGGPVDPAGDAADRLRRALYAAALEGRAVGVAELARAARRGRSWVYEQLAAGLAAGRVARAGRGRYQLPPDPAGAAGEAPGAGPPGAR